MKMRYRIVELIVAASVVVISVASLFVAVHQSIVMERTLAASVWPVMEFQHGNYDSEAGRRSITLDFANNGLGPAQVRYMRLLDDGQPIDSMQHYLAECCAPEDLDQTARLDHIGQLFRDDHLLLVTDVIGGRVFAPQQTVTFARFDYPDDRDGQLAWAALDAVRFELEIELCYCSVFDECWLARFPQQSREPVNQCRIDSARD